jgi:hypothetical protein
LGLSVGQKASLVRTFFRLPPSAKSGSMKAPAAPVAVEKYMSGYASTHVVNMLDSSASKEEASPLRRRRRHASKSPPREVSVETSKVAGAPVVEGSTS